MISEATGEIELDGKVLVIRRIHVHYYLQIEADEEKREMAERVLGFHARFCPVARTIQNCVEITTSLEMEDVDD